VLRLFLSEYGFERCATPITQHHLASKYPAGGRGDAKSPIAS
jgi:hypothetical protein